MNELILRIGFDIKVSTETEYHKEQLKHVVSAALYRLRKGYTVQDGELSLHLIPDLSSINYNTIFDVLWQRIHALGPSEIQSKHALKYAIEQLNKEEIQHVLLRYRNKYLDDIDALSEISFDMPEHYIEQKNYFYLLQFLKPHLFNWFLRQNKNAWYLKNFGRVDQNKK